MPVRFDRLTPEQTAELPEHRLSRLLNSTERHALATRSGVNPFVADEVLTDGCAQGARRCAVARVWERRPCLDSLGR